MPDTQLKVAIPAWREAEALVHESRARMLDALLVPLEETREMLDSLGYPEAVRDLLTLRGTLRTIRSDLMDRAETLRAEMEGRAHGADA